MVPHMAEEGGFQVEELVAWEVDRQILLAGTAAVTSYRLLCGTRKGQEYRTR